MNFFDTNVLVASAIPSHPHHSQSFERLSRLRGQPTACAAHTLAETYNTLTRTRPYGLPPFAALTIIEQVSTDFELVSLTSAEILLTLQEASKEAIHGAMIFDALLIACARKVHASAIYTNDLKHFRRIAPDLAATMHEP